MCDDGRGIGDSDRNDVEDSAPPLPAADSVLSAGVDADRLRPDKATGPPPSADAGRPAVRTTLVVGIDSDEADAALQWATRYGTHRGRRARLRSVEVSAGVRR